MREIKCDMKTVTVSAAAILLLISCSTNQYSTPPPSTACNSLTAEIAVGDDYLQPLCGCGTANGTVVLPPTQLTCNITAGAYVYFEMVGNNIPHQIAPSGTNTFTLGPYSDPKANPQAGATVIQFATPNTYGFKDLLNPGINGQIVVAP